SGLVSPLGVIGEFPDTSRADDAVVFEIPRMQSALSRIALSADAPSAPVALAPSTGDDFAPAVSPDGSRVVFVSDRSRQYQLWLHDLASGEARPLTDSASTSVTAPSWTLDGRSVVAVERNPDGRRLVEIDVSS